MEQGRAVNKVVMDLLQFKLIQIGSERFVRLHLQRLYVAGYEEGRKEIHVHHAKKVVRCDKDGKELETYNTVVEAARKINYGTAGIYFAIYRKTVTKNGYRWKYKEDEMLGTSSSA
jgi:hypothetical protein